jgi:hypothetical protein
MAAAVISIRILPYLKLTTITSVPEPSKMNATLKERRVLQVAHFSA